MIARHPAQAANLRYSGSSDIRQAVIAAAIAAVAPSRAQQRRLAGALAGDPGLLTSGHPEGPPQIELLIRVLLAAGAERLVLPGCAHCGQPKRLVQCDGKLRICSACDRRRRGAAEPCAACGNPGQVAYRDEHGQPRCARCRPYDSPGSGSDPVAGVMTHVSNLRPGLDQLRQREVIQQVIPRPFQQHQVLWELDRNPGLLTGEGAHGSPRVNGTGHPSRSATSATWRCTCAADGAGVRSASPSARSRSGSGKRDRPRSARTARPRPASPPAR